MELQRKRQTILIVDDASVNVIALGNLLREEYEILTARSGEKALKIAMVEKIDLILLDILMPKMDGYEVCRILKNDVRTRDIPVIFITGVIDEASEVKGFQLGAVDYIIKPFNPVIVKARVKTHADLRKYQNHLETMSYRDGLTGIANRRKFNEYLDFVWNLGVRESFPASLIMIDIDHFKSFNDSYGHQEGDLALIKVAQTLADSVTRKTDLVVRYGGEEFACILLNTTMKDALIVAERFRKNVLALKIPHQASPTGHYLTISLGVATMIPNLMIERDHILKDADDALYRSKEMGRNRVSK